MKRIIISGLTLLVFMLLSLNAMADEETDKLNVNTASVEELQKVPGITPQIAAAIVQYREDMGDIQSLDELVEVEGITKDLLGKIKNFLSVDAISGSECTC